MFELTNDKPRPKPMTFDAKEGKQKVLFSGLDCLPGQMDLFATDGVVPPKPTAEIPPQTTLKRDATP